MNVSRSSAQPPVPHIPYPPPFPPSPPVPPPSRPPVILGFAPPPPAAPPAPPDCSLCDAGAPCGKCLMVDFVCPSGVSQDASANVQSQTCLTARVGELCEGDGECGTDPELDNCHSFGDRWDMYRVTSLCGDLPPYAPPDPRPPFPPTFPPPAPPSPTAPPLGPPWSARDAASTAFPGLLTIAALCLGSGALMVALVRRWYAPRRERIDVNITTTTRQGDVTCLAPDKTATTSYLPTGYFPTDILALSCSCSLSCACLWSCLSCLSCLTCRRRCCEAPGQRSRDPTSPAS